MRRIDSDHFDAKRNIPKVAENALSKAVIYTAPVATVLAARGTLLETAATGVMAMTAIGMNTEDLVRAGIKLIPRGQIVDRRIGYHAQPFVYRGSNSLEIKDRSWHYGDEILGEGDNFYWLNLPEVNIKRPGDDKTSQQALTAIRNEIWTDAAITSLRQFRNRSSNVRWKAVALPGLESMPQEVRDKLPPSTLVKMAELFDNKGIHPQKLGEKEVAVITSRDLEEFFDPKPVQIKVPEEVIKYEPIKVPVIEEEWRLSDLAQSLENRWAREQIQAIFDATDPKYQQRLLVQLGQKLDQIMVDEIEKGHVDPAVRLQTPFWKNGAPHLPEPGDLQPEPARPEPEQLSLDVLSEDAPRQPFKIPHLGGHKGRSDRIQTESTLILRPGAGGVKYVHRFFAAGGVDSRRVDVALGLNPGRGPYQDRNWDELKGHNPNQGQIAYLIAEVIKRRGVRGLFESHEVEREVERRVPKVEIEDVERTIWEAMQIKPVDQVVDEAVGWEMKLRRSKKGPPGPSLFDWKIFLHEAKTIKPKLKNLAGALALLGTSALLGNFLTPRPSEEAYADQVEASQRPSGLIVDLSRSIQRMFQENQNTSLVKPIAEAAKDLANLTAPQEPTLPSDAIVWRIQEVEGMSSSGYYSVSTSHTYNNGEWELNKTREKKLDLPREVEGPQLKLYQFESVNPANGYTFKVPIRHGTKVGALNIKDMSGKQLETEIYQLSDGTVEVVIPPFLGVGHLYINAALVSSTERGVHATHAIPPVDLSKLSERAIQNLNQGLAAENKFSESLAHSIRSSHKYSLKPQGYEKLKPVQTPEERVNVIADWTECWCFACGEVNTLLSTHHPEGVSVNLAMGFLHFIGGPASEDPTKRSEISFLREDIRHAWSVDLYGMRWDPTPGDAANDELTQRYLRQLQRIPSPPNQLVATAQTLLDAIVATRTPTPNTPVPPTQTPIFVTATPTETPMPTDTPTPSSDPNTGSLIATPPTSTLQATAEVGPTAKVGPSPITSPEAKTEAPDPESWLDKVPGWVPAAAAAAALAGAAGGAGYWLRRRKQPQVPEPEEVSQPTFIPPDDYKQMRNGDWVTRISGKNEVVTQNDVLLGREFLTWAGYGASQKAINLRGITDSQLNEKYASRTEVGLDNLRNNVSTKHLDVYLRHPELYENSAGLTPEQGQRMRKLAQILLDLAKLP